MSTPTAAKGTKTVLAAKQYSMAFMFFVALRRCVLSAVLLTLGGTASAQNLPALRLSLDEAQTRAAAASHRLAEARAREAAAQSAVAVRQAAERPIVSLAAGYTRTNNVTEFIVPSATGAPRVLYPDIPDNYRTRLDLQWPIYTGGRADALVRAARAEASAVASEVEAAQADLRLEVARAFWALVTARATVAVLEESLGRAGAHLGEVRERFNTGLVPPNEVASAEAQESRQRMLLIEARNQRDLSSADLSRLIGTDLDQPVEPDARLETAAAGPSGAGAPGPPGSVCGTDPCGRPTAGASSLVSEARATRHERRALELRIDAADAQRAAAQGGRRPAVSIAGGVDYARPNPRIFPRADRWDESWDAGVTVGWALWDGGRAEAEAAQASGLATAARQRLAEFDSYVALEVRQRLLEIDSGRAAITAAADSVRAAAEARRVVAERYRAGVITQAEMLDADVALLQAELDRTRAAAAVRLAEARLARAVGR